MSSVKNNNILEKTSFLYGNNSKFIEDLYTEYLSNPSKVPNEWREFFDGLNEKKDLILKTAEGPSWAPKKIKKGSKNLLSSEESERATEKPKISPEAVQESVKASMFIRAYRIRGHLKSNLDPLGLQKKEEHKELMQETYGFTNKDLDKRVYIDGAFGLQSSSMREITNLLKKNLLWKDWL